MQLHIFYSVVAFQILTFHYCIDQILKNTRKVKKIYTIYKTLLPEKNGIVSSIPQLHICKFFAVVNGCTALHY